MRSPPGRKRGNFVAGRPVPNPFVPSANAPAPSSGPSPCRAGLAINPNYAPLYAPRSVSNSALGRFEQAKSDAEQAMRLSPHDPLIGVFHMNSADAELGLGHFDAAIDEYHHATDFGFRPFFVYADLAAAYALEGKMDEAKTALAEARQSQTHRQMAAIRRAEYTGPFRRPPQGGAAGGMTATCPRHVVPKPAQAYEPGDSGRLRSRVSSSWLALDPVFGLRLSSIMTPCARSRLWQTWCPRTA